ncbi:MAG: response regulator [Elusimicrobia bacterium]|nr:response regulator [Elusimicrobiota bacterium]
MKVLIIEDDYSLADNITALLKLKGHEVGFAPDGEAGIEVARQMRPDLILLDIMIPKVGGFDACRILRGDPQTMKAKIIMMTGLDRIGDVERAFSAGASDYLIKPFDSERLFKKIDKVTRA